MVDNPLDRMRNALDLFGSQNTLDIIQYTLHRDALDSRYFSRNSRSAAEIGSYMGYSENEMGATFRFSNEELIVQFLNESVVSIEWKREGQSGPVINHSVSFQAPAGKLFEIVEDSNSFRISARSCEIRISRNGIIEFISQGGQVMRRDFPPVFMSDGFKHSVEMAEGSRIYGFGEKAFTLNLRGRRLKLWNRDADGKYGSGSDPLYLGMPLYLSTSKEFQYMCFYENSSQADFDLGSSQLNTITGDFLTGPPKYYLIFGDIKSLYRNYALLTGFPHMPPEWSFGFHQSRWSYMDDREVESIAEGFRKHDLPVSAIHLDIDYMDGFRVFTFDRERFAKIGELTEKLGKDGIRIVTIIDPAVKWDPEYSVFREGLDKDYYCSAPDGNTIYAPVWPGSAAFPDFSSDEVRKWWGGQYEKLLKAGISGFWHDMNEPAAFVLWGDNSLPLCAVHKLGKHVSVHNTYALFMAQAAYESLSTLKGQERPFILSRSGWSGQQKYSWIWTGDSESTWEQLRTTVSTVLGLSLSGIPFTGPDIGGFAGSPSSELFLRWFQMSSFLPFFRTHSSKGYPMREPWNFGEPFLSIIRKYLKNRYMLLPYIYSEAYRTHVTGEPMIKPLFWIEPELEGTDTESAFLLGDSMLVAPVTSPNADGVRIRLPDGPWYSYWNPDVSYTGGNTASIGATLDEIPVLVRGKSIVPLNREGILEIHLYFGKEEGEFAYEMHRDDSLIDGKASTENFRVTEEGDGISLEWRRSGSLEFDFRKIRVVLHGRTIRAAAAGNGRLEVSGSDSVETEFPFETMKMKKS